MVFTSADIRVGYWVQRKFAPPYELAMRKMNDVLTASHDAADRDRGRRASASLLGLARR